MLIRCAFQKWFKKKNGLKKSLFVFALIVFFIFGFVLFFNIFLYLYIERLAQQSNSTFLTKFVKESPAFNNAVALLKNQYCHYYNCFNPYKCGHNGEHNIKIFVYSFQQYVAAKSAKLKTTREFYNILEVIKKSKYYTTNSQEACIFVPSVDMINQDLFSEELPRILTSLPFWNGGENHLMFDLVPRNYPKPQSLPSGNAMIAGTTFSTWTYRTGFDISVPFFSPLSNHSNEDWLHDDRSWFIVLSQLNIQRKYRDKLNSLSEIHSDLHVLERCNNSSRNFVTRCYKKQAYKYPYVLKNAVFCIILNSGKTIQTTLHETLAFGCIPVIVADSIIMPFHEVIDWKRAAVFVSENHLHSVVDILRSVSVDRILEMKEQGLWLYRKYLSSWDVIVDTVLEILNERVFPLHAKPYEYWNLRTKVVGTHQPIFLRARSSRSQGFTAVILGYERVDSLFQLVEGLSAVPTLSKILVIWNNQHKRPPNEWPSVDKPLKVIQTSANKLSNRFYPYKEIETDAVLSLDDDITMLTADELDFGFEVWREFPDRIVGFPSRTHIWDNITSSWRYESEWTNEISMVLTGAAFYHKYWNYLYTTSMPKSIFNWVDDHMNCEDIAMNFLVANVTSKAPIKVTPRKKFKCPECTNTEMLSADIRHMAERSECINKFAQIYGRMPLKTVEFRADPVLYKDNFPPVLKKYRDIGSL